MKNTINKELKVGARVSYTLPAGSLRATPEYKESVITGEYHDGRFNYICLENGDKVFKHSLTIIDRLTKSDLVKGLKVIDKALPFVSTTVLSEIDEDGMVEVLKECGFLHYNFHYKCKTTVHYRSIILNSKRGAG